jgi:hypothetical protein
VYEVWGNSEKSDVFVLRAALSGRCAEHLCAEASCAQTSHGVRGKPQGVTGFSFPSGVAPGPVQPSLGRRQAPLPWKKKHDLRECSLRGSSPRPMAHRTIALTTELKEPAISVVTKVQLTLTIRPGVCRSPSTERQTARLPAFARSRRRAQTLQARSRGNGF